MKLNVSSSPSNFWIKSARVNQVSRSSSTTLFKPPRRRRRKRRRRGGGQYSIRGAGLSPEREICRSSLINCRVIPRDFIVSEAGLHWVYIWASSSSLPFCIYVHIFRFVNFMAILGLALYQFVSNFHKIVYHTCTIYLFKLRSKWHYHCIFITREIIIK